MQDEINPFLPKCYTKQQRAYKDTFKQKEKEIKKFTSGTCRIPVKVRAHHYISAGWEGTLTDTIKTVFFPTLQCNGSTPSSSSAMCTGSCTHSTSKDTQNSYTAIHNGRSHITKKTGFVFGYFKETKYCTENTYKSPLTFLLKLKTSYLPALSKC